MYCPKCGQEQASESVRFCSRCGFKLNTVEEALAKRLIKMAMYLVLTICAISGWGSITTGPGYMGVRVIITLIAAITFYLLFSRDLKHIFYKLFSQYIEQIKQVRSASQESALPLAQTMPVPTLGSHRVNTAEMVQPPSVTEHTTRLLDTERD
ncbi:MAG: zinc ribbon domain-containing protein [Acidobacteria bacterium]|nr:zinc ribbon domain-containing protein [Acidobacteriota bacterium]